MRAQSEMGQFYQFLKAHSPDPNDHRVAGSMPGYESGIGEKSRTQRFRGNWMIRPSVFDMLFQEPGHKRSLRLYEYTDHEEKQNDPKKPGLNWTLARYDGKTPVRTEEVEEPLFHAAEMIGNIMDSHGIKVDMTVVDQKRGAIIFSAKQEAFVFTLRKGKTIHGKIEHQDLIDAPAAQ